MSLPRVLGLLVGIDRYEIGPESSFEDLDGAVRDARKVHEYLVNDLGLPAEDLRLLTASRGLSREPREPLEDRPGYRQLVATLRALGARAAPDDLFFFYYSGHGVRVPSFLPNRTGFDECLVPCDANRPEGRLLHDLELAYLLAELATRGIDSVVVLDACFAGGALRGESRVRARGAGTLPAPLPQAPSSVAAPAELKAFAERRGIGRSDWFGSWLSGSPRHTFLAACAAHELALEAPLEDGRVGGLFTAALLSGLRRSGPGSASYRQLLARTRADLLTAGSRQIPQAEGALDRPFLGRISTGRVPGVAVLEARGDGTLRVAAGALHGLASGALFRYPPVGPSPMALEAIEVDDHSSVLRVLGGAGNPSIAPGDLVGLLSPAPWRLLRRVRLIGDAATVPGFAAALAHPRPDEERFVRLAEESEDADFRVEGNAEGRLEVTTVLGEALDLGPALEADDPAAPRELARRLAHVARFEAVLGLRNRSSATELREAVSIEVDGAVALEPATLETGRPLALRAVNRSDRVLYVTLLSLGADWSVEQLWPRGMWASLEPGQATPELRVAAELPAGFDRGRAVLKAFASESPASFDWLELPALLAPEPPSALRTRVPTSPLDEFLKAWTTGHVSASAMLRSTAGDWGTAEWQVALHRSTHRSTDPGNSD
jgi:hypothetical protein